MGIFNIFKPEQQIRHAANKGDNATELSGGPMRSVFIKNEDEPILPIVEQPVIAEQSPAALEQRETELENKVEKNKEMIEESFSQVFSIDNNRDVRIFSEKKDKETTIGTYLTTGFYDSGALHELRKMFVEKYGDATDLNEDKMSELVKDFCLENLDKVTCPVDTRTAIEAVCNKGKAQEPQLPAAAEKIDEKLMNDLRNTEIEFRKYFSEFELKESDFFEKDEIGVEREKEGVDRYAFITEKWEELVKRYDDKKERTPELLAEFILCQDALKKLEADVAVWRKEKIENDELLKKTEPLAIATEPAGKDVRTKKEKEEGRLNYRLERMAYAFEIWKSNIEELSVEKGDELKPLSYYTKKAASPKKAGIVGEYLEKLNAEIENTENKIKEIWKAKKSEFTKAEKIGKKETERVESHEVAPWVGEFEKAISKIKTMTMDEAVEKYEVSQNLDAAAGDYAKVLNGFLQAHEHDSHDKFADIEGISFENAKKAVVKVNAADCDFDLVVINGNTYKFKKEKALISAVDAAVENDGDNQETERKEIFNATLEMTRNFRDHLAEAFGQDDGWKKYRKEHQDNILKGEVVAFLDELLEQENIVAEDEKENFIENILGEMRKI